MDTNALAAIISAVAALVTALVLVARRPDDLHRIRQMVELEALLPDGPSKDELQAFREDRLRRWVRHESGFDPAIRYLCILGFTFAGVSALPQIILALAPDLPTTVQQLLNGLTIYGFCFMMLTFVATVLVLLLAIVAWIQRRKKAIDPDPNQLNSGQ